MKTTAQLLAITALAALLGSATTFADDPQLQNRLTAQRQTQGEKTTTVALYGHRKGVGKTTAKADTSGLTVREHVTPHGTSHYLLVPAK